MSDTPTRRAVTLAAGADVRPGSLLAEIGSVTATAAAAEANTGHAELTGLAATTALPIGAYTVDVHADGALSVTTPGNASLGDGVLGQPFAAGGLSLTVGTEAHEGDRWTVTVAAGATVHTLWDPSATDGAQTIQGVAYGWPVSAGVGESVGQMTIAGPLSRRAALWPASLTDAQRTAAEARLATLGFDLAD